MKNTLFLTAVLALCLAAAVAGRKDAEEPATTGVLHPAGQPRLAFVQIFQADAGGDDGGQPSCIAIVE